MFVIRTIKNGKVKINGKIYIPDTRYVQYDGRLDGLKYAFATYKNEDKFVNCWGTLETYKNQDDSFGKERMGNGTLPWMFWNIEKE